MNVTTKKVKLSDINLNPDNPRTISSKAMGRLVKSMADFPDMMKLREIVVDETMTVLGGNMRLQALRKLGIKEVTAKIVEGFTPEQKREFIIKDNAAFGEWDFDALANSWDDLPLIDFGVPVPANFDEIRETKDIPETGEVEFSPELLLEHNYIVLYFDNPLDWEVAVTKYGLKKVKSCDPAEKCQKIGIGRVVAGKDYL